MFLEYQNPNSIHKLKKKKSLHWRPHIHVATSSVTSLPTIEYPAVRPVSQTNPAVADVVVTVIRILDYFMIHQSGVHAARNLPGDADVVFCSQYKILINHLEEDIL